MKNPTARPTPASPSAKTRPQQGASIARRQATVTARRPAQTVRPQAQATTATTTLPVSAYRILASASLVLLLILTAVGPRTASAPETSALLTPSIAGGNSLPGEVAANDVENSLFRYRSIIERNLGNTPTIPDNIADVLHYPPSSERVRRLLIGQMYASSSGNLNETVVDSGFFSHLDSSGQFISDVENAYSGLLGGDNPTRGVNGLGVMSLVRSLSANGQERYALEQGGIAGIQQAASEQPTTWQFTYNWALANMMLGNYAAAYDGMSGIVASAEKDNNRWPRFWMGLAALRMGDPGLALQDFRNVMDIKVSGGNQPFQDLLARERDLASEGFADAQWANRDPADAYNSYLNVLANGNTDDTGLYNKWLQLGLQQRAYDRLAADMANLESSGSGFSKTARLHHDRARLLTFLGRNAEAENEYKQAMSLGENDPSLNISYGQFLESEGDHNGALGQVDIAIRGLGKDPATSDLTSVAHAVALTTTAYSDLYNAQQLLDANLLRAHAWGASNQTSQLDNLVNNIALGAASAPAQEAGLLQYYSGAAAEAGGAYDKAATAYSAAWDKLKSLPAGTNGRAAALAGLARATAKTKDAAAGVQVLATNGYDPASPKETWTTDPDAPDILYQGAVLLQAAGKAADSTNAMRVSAVLRNTQDAHQLNGAGRPLWDASGVTVPAEAMLVAADQSRTTPGTDPNQTAYLYKQVYTLDPSMAAAWNNLGVTYAEAGNSNLANFYLGASSKVSPGYALGQHNQAALQYNQGIGNFFNAESAQAGAIKAAGPETLNWGYNVQADNGTLYPQPTVPPNDIFSRLPAVLILLLLLVHTVVGNDRVSNRTGILPTKGALGMAASWVDQYAARAFPGILKPGSSATTLLVTILLPSVIAMFGLALFASRWSLSVALLYLPVALVVALLAFAARELVQRWVASRHGAVALYHPWPLGVLIGILSIPFGFTYGWQSVARLRPAHEVAGAGQDGNYGRQVRTEEEQDLAYEAQVEALAEMSPEEARARAGAPIAASAPSKRLFNLSPASRIMTAGLLADLVLVVIFGAAYLVLAWPSLRLAMYASALVLVFTAVSEPPADGWTLYRRNGPLWLVIFAVAATVVTLLAANLL